MSSVEIQLAPGSPVPDVLNSDGHSDGTVTDDHHEDPSVDHDEISLAKQTYAAALLNLRTVRQAVDFTEQYTHEARLGLHRRKTELELSLLDSANELAEGAAFVAGTAIGTTLAVTYLAAGTTFATLYHIHEASSHTVDTIKHRAVTAVRSTVESTVDGIKNISLQSAEHIKAKLPPKVVERAQDSYQLIVADPIGGTDKTLELTLPKPVYSTLKWGVRTLLDAKDSTVQVYNWGVGKVSDTTTKTVETAQHWREYVETASTGVVHSVLGKADETKSAVHTHVLKWVGTSAGVIGLGKR